MKRCLAYLLVIASFVFINCGNKPPEEFYDGTPADDSAIVNLLNANPDLLETEDFYDPGIIGINLPAVSFPVSDSFYRDVDPIIKQHVDSIGLELTQKIRFQDLWYAKDTTCTVYLWDTFTVIGSIHWDRKLTGHYDKDTIIGTDTLHKLNTIDVDSTGGPGEISGIVAEGLRHLFFECKRDSTKPESLGGKIVYPIKDPREWQLKRISYGTYSFPNRGAERATIDNVIVQKGTDVDTIFSSKYDTLYAGHVMNRFRSVDSLFQFAAGDTLVLTINLSALSPVLSGDCTFYTVFNGVRKQLANGTGTVILDPVAAAGIRNFYVEVVSNSALFYIAPVKEYQASVWMIPFEIQ